MTSSSDGKKYIAKIRRNLCILIVLSEGVEILDVYFSSTTACSIIIIGCKETTQHHRYHPHKDYYGSAKCTPAPPAYSRKWLTTENPLP